MLNRIRMERETGPNVPAIIGLGCALLLAMPSFFGCQPQDATSTTPAPASATPDATPTVAGAQGATGDPQPGSTAELERETWDAVFMGGTKVGHTRTRFEPLPEDDQQLVQIKAESQMSMKRFDQTVEQKIAVTSVEHPDGRLVRFSSSMGTPPNDTSTTGRFERGQLHLTTTTPGKAEKTALAWDPQWSGFFGTEQSLQNKPMKPGEKRTVKSLMAVFNMVGESQFTAVGYETTKLLSGERTLLRIESSTKIGGTQIESVIWTDEQGETLKTSIPALNQETYRTNREIALRTGSGPAFDLGAASVVKVARRLARPHLTQNIVYRAAIQDGDPTETFPSGPTQSVKRLDEHTAEITVIALRPETATGGALGTSQPPTDDDLAPNNLIQSDDPAVIKIAGSVAADQSNPWFVAQALEKRIQELVDVTEFSQAIASAAEVAQSRQGDCTEHAMLLAAVCRARQIPARVAIGLVYYGQAGGFAYHMWTEVWIDRHWIPLDATLGQGGIGAAHLKVAESNLAGASGYTAILPVFDVMGRLELKIVAVDPSP